MLKKKPRSRLIILCTSMLGLALAAQSQSGTDPQQGVQAQSGALVMMTPKQLPAPPPLTPARQAALQAALNQKANHQLPVGPQAPVVSPADLSLQDAPDVSAGPPPVNGAPFVAEVLSPLDPIGTGGLPATSIGEPSLAQSGGHVFFTGNWYAAQANTANPGQFDWNYIDPSVGMPDFCCDQDAIADRGRDMILWTRLGGTNGRFVLSESTDGGNSFCSWELNPGQLGIQGGYDQPLMALTNNNVYITGAIFGAAFHNVLLKISLDTLQDCPGGFNYTWFDITDANGWGGMVSGATTTMYLASHRGLNNTLRIYSQPEGTNSLFRNDVGIPAFTFQNRNSSCIIGGTNPCSRSDSRIQAGWVRKGTGQTVGELGFMWDAREGGGFPWAYLEAATLREDNLAVTGRPLIAYNDAAVEYPYASPDARGNLGLTTYFMGGSRNPDAVFYTNDDFGGFWTFDFYLQVSDTGAGAWGDYVRNRSYLPCQTGWSTASLALQNGTVVPQLSIVSRNRDSVCINRYLNAP